MCESTAYMKKDNHEEMVMENVSVIPTAEGNRFILRGLLGDSMEITGKLEDINLMEHKIIFSEL